MSVYTSLYIRNIHIYIMGSYNETIIKFAGWSQLKVKLCFLSNSQTYSVTRKFLGQVHD